MSAAQPDPIETGRAAGSVLAKVMLPRGTDNDISIGRPVVPHLRRSAPVESDACLAGELAAARVAAHEPHVPLDRWPCTGRCGALTVDEARQHGERLAQCPCRAAAGLPSPGAGA